MTKKSVLVIGGGVAGHQIAYQLRDLADVTLVDPKTYWEVPMALPRLLVEPDGLPARIRYDSFLGRARHIRGRATRLTDSAAQVALGNEARHTTIGFDYAVIATGSAYVDPLVKAQAITEGDRAIEIASVHQRIRDASAVVVVGGGPVGVETAAELRETFPHLAITLVHGGSKLLDAAPSKFPNWAERALRASAVEVILDDVVTYPAVSEQPRSGEVRTAKGRKLPADVMIWAGGAKLNTDWIKTSWPAAVQEDGRLKVDRFLRLEGHSNVFVAGDVTDMPEGRLAIVAGLHVKSVVGNLKSLLNADSPQTAKLKPYKPALPGKGMGRLMVVTLGRKDGLTSLPFGQFRASFLARKIKSRDMLVGMSMKALGMPAPTAIESKRAERVAPNALLNARPKA